MSVTFTNKIIKSIINCSIMSQQIIKLKQITVIALITSVNKNDNNYSKKRREVVIIGLKFELF